MPKMTYEEVRYWIKEADSCQKRQDVELRDKNHYPFLINYYEGDQYDEASRLKRNQRKLCVINEYFPNVNAIIAEIMYQNPDVLAEPTKPDGEENAPIMKSALEYGFKKLDALTENRLGLFDMIMAGYCGVEVNHINSKNIEEQPRPGQNEESLLGKVGRKVKEAVTGEKIEEGIEKTLPPVEIAYSTPDETYLRRWNPLDILLDYRAERLKDMRYTIKKIRLSYAEFVAKYPDYAGKITTDESIPFSEQINDEHKKTVLLYEFQLRQKNRYVNFIVTKSFNLHEIDFFERPYITNGFNLKIGTLSEYGKLYPVSFAQINKAIQDDINNYTTFMMEVAERNIPKIGVDKNKVKPDGIAALKSTKVNDIVEVDGSPSNHIHPLHPTSVSNENKELLGLFKDQKDKLWAVSGPRLGKTGDAKFMGELEIQEAGFMARQSDIQEGLRKLMVAELDTLKDIIAQFWDDPMFFKITGQGKPDWYISEIVPNPQTGGTMVKNPLSDILTRDYEIDIDIASSLKPNKERKKKELMEFATWLIERVEPFLNARGQRLEIEAIKKVMKEWGWNPETLINEGGQGEGMPEMSPEVPIAGQENVL